MNKKSINVLIIDDHPVIIEGFKKVLNFIAQQLKQYVLNQSAQKIIKRHIIKHSSMPPLNIK